MQNDEEVGIEWSKCEFETIYSVSRIIDHMQEDHWSRGQRFPGRNGDSTSEGVYA